MSNFGAMQNEIYNAGLRGILPTWPVDFATLEKRAHEALGPGLTNYVAGVAAMSTRRTAMRRPSTTGAWCRA